MLQTRSEVSDTAMGLGGLSIGHWLIVLAVVLLVFGTKRLTSGAKDLGAAVKEFKKGMRDGGDKPAAQLGSETSQTDPARKAEQHTDR